MDTKRYNNYSDMITFSRTSSATALTKVAYGAELVTNGTFDTDATGWAHNNTSGTSTFSVTGGEATFTRDTFGDSFYQTDVAPAVAGVYLLTFDITAISGGGLRYSFSPNSAANPSNQVTASSVGSYSTQFVSDGTFLDFVFDLNTNGASVTIDNISVKEVLVNQPTGTLSLARHGLNTPRVEYDANGVAKGLLIEEARTNYNNDSRITSSGWVNVRASLDTSEGALFLDGVTAPRLKEDTTAFNTHHTQDVHTLSSSSAVAVFSIFVKKPDLNSKSYVVLKVIDDPAGSFKSYTVVFDASDGSFQDDGITGSPSSTFYGSTQYPNGWLRVWVGFTKGGVAARTDAQIALSNVSTVDATGTLPVYSGDGVSGLYVCGAQMEEGSFPTSYIPTSGATATRSADIASVPVSEFGYNEAHGSVVTVFSADRDLNSNAVLVNLSDGTLLNRMTNWAGSVSGTQLYVVHSNTPQASLAAGIPTAGSHKSGIAYATNDFALTLDAGTIQSDTSGTVPTVSQIDIGRYVNNVPLNGHIKSIAYYPRRLTNAQLQELTS